MEVGWLDRDGAAEIPLRVRPGAPRDAAGGLHGGALKVSVTARAQDGQANAAVVRVLAKALRVPRSAVQLVSGQKARDKRVRVQGISVADARARLGV